MEDMSYVEHLAENEKRRSMRPFLWLSGTQSGEITCYPSRWPPGRIRGLSVFGSSSGPTGPGYLGQYTYPQAVRVVQSPGE